MGNAETRRRFSKLKSVTSIHKDNYLEAATGCAL